MPIGNSGLLLIVMAAGVGASLFIVLLVATRRVARLLDDRHRSRVEPPVRLLLIQAIADNHIEPELILARGSRGRAQKSVVLDADIDAYDLVVSLVPHRASDLEPFIERGVAIFDAAGTLAGRSGANIEHL